MTELKGFYPTPSSQVLPQSPFFICTHSVGELFILLNYIHKLTTPTSVS